MDEFSDVPIDLTCAVNKRRRRSSFFDLPLKTKPEKFVRLEEYVEKMHKEKADWMKLATQVEKRVKNFAKTKELTFDSTVMSEQQKEYMDNAVDLHEYVKGFKIYSQDCLLYAKRKEWTEFRVKDRESLLKEEIKDFTIEQISMKE